MTLNSYLISLFSCLVALAVFGSIAHFASAGGAGQGVRWTGTPYTDQNLNTYQPTPVSGNGHWSMQYEGIDLAYAWNRWTLQSTDPGCFTGAQSGNFSSDTCISGFGAAGSDLAVEINHEARVYDAATGTQIENGAVLTPGKQVRLEFTPLVPENIFWFATGYSLDSPYGEWRAGATAPSRVQSTNGGINSKHVTCDARDYANSITLDDWSRWEGCMATMRKECAEAEWDEITNEEVCTAYYYQNPYSGQYLDEAGASQTCIMQGYGPRTGYRFDVYAPLVMNPPTRTFDYGGLTGCTTTTPSEAGGLAVLCTVPNTPAAALTPTFKYGETYGYFYYRYRDDRNMNYSGQPGPHARNYGGPGCYGNNIPLHKVRDEVKNSPNYDPFDERGLRVSQVEDEPFTVEVPEITIPFSFTVASVGNPPAVPTITGPTQGLPSTNHSFSFTSTDPDGNTIRYGVDWNNDGVLDQWLPALGYVTSGTSQNASRSWPSDGSRTFRVLAQDSNNNSSAWATHTIAIGTPPSCTFGSSATIIQGQSTALTWSCTGANSCTGSGFTAGGSSGSVSVTPSSSTSYGLSCTGTGGTTSVPPVTVTVGCPMDLSGDLVPAVDRVREGTGTTLTWNATGVNTSCTISGPNVNQTVAGASCNAASAGPVSTGNLTTQAIYRLTCDGVEVDRAIVNVQPQLIEF